MLLMAITPIGVISLTINSIQNHDLEPEVLKVKEVPVPWLFWENRLEMNGIGAVIRLGKEYKQDVGIRRAYMLSDVELPLEDLMWGDTMNLTEWQPIDDPEFPPYRLAAGEEVEYIIEDIRAETKAILFKYSVARAGDLDLEVAHFVTEAVLDQGIVGKGLYNFDVHNDFFLPINNFELEIYSDFTLTPDDVIKWYDDPFGKDPELIPSYTTYDPISGQYVTIGPLWVNGWGTPPQINQQPYGLEVIWKDLKHPVKKCEWIHLGVTLKIQKKVKEVAFPWGLWDYYAGGVQGDVVLPADILDQAGVAIVRDYAVLNEALPLEALNYDINLSWEPIDDPEQPYILYPGEVASYFINTTMDTEAVLLRYSVSPIDDPESPFAHFINEAVLENRGIIGMYSNPDVHNDYNESVDNFEMELYGLDPSNILYWYKDPPLRWENKTWGPTLYGGWGIPPIIKWLPGNIGTEVKWKDRNFPIEPCKWVHFGLAINLNPDSVKGYWTQLIVPTKAVGHFTISLSRDLNNKPKDITQRTKMINHPFLQFLDSHPNLFPIIRQLLAL